MLQRSPLWCGGERQANLDRCALAAGALDVNVAPGGSRYAVGNGETQARAAFLGGKQRIENLLEYLCRNPDAVVVDPPRKGLDAEVRSALAEGSAGVLVYVSCEPRSLARDLGHLHREAGFRVERVTAVDLMPGTAQVEAVAICRR